MRAVCDPEEIRHERAGCSGETAFGFRHRREPFTDPTPYLPVINNWLLAASGQLLGASAPHQPISTPQNPALTPAQAQTVKTSLLDALFAVKRQAPITVGGQTYNASDAETSAMSNQIAAASEQVIDALNAEVATLPPATNTALAGVKSTTDAAMVGLMGPAPVGVESSRSRLRTPYPLTDHRQFDSLQFALVGGTGAGCRPISGSQN
jgi:hypothetical protein